MTVTFAKEFPWLEYIDHLTAVVAKRVAAPAVEDVVGEILLKVVRHRAELDEVSSPIAWMTRIALNTIADYHRRSAVEQRTKSEWAADAQTQNAVADDGEGIEQSIAGCVLPFIQELPPLDAQVLILTDLDGMTQRAAAEQLGLSISGMKSRVQRARIRLRDALATCCAVQFDRRGGVLEVTRRTSDNCHC